MTPITFALIFFALILSGLIAFVAYLGLSKPFRERLIRAEFEDDYGDLWKKIHSSGSYESYKLLVSFRERWMNLIDTQTLSDACESLSNRIKELSTKVS